MRSQCIVVFAAVGADGKLTAVAHFEPATQEEIEHRNNALARIKVREEVVAAMKAQ